MTSIRVKLTVKNVQNKYIVGISGKQIIGISQCNNVDIDSLAEQN